MVWAAGLNSPLNRVVDKGDALSLVLFILIYYLIYYLILNVIYFDLLSEQCYLFWFTIWSLVLFILIYYLIIRIPPKPPSDNRLTVILSSLWSADHQVMSPDNRHLIFQNRRRSAMYTCCEIYPTAKWLENRVIEFTKDITRVAFVVLCNAATIITIMSKMTVSVKDDYWNWMYSP